MESSEPQVNPCWAPAVLGTEGAKAGLGIPLGTSRCHPELQGPARPGSSGVKIIWGVLELSVTFSRCLRSAACSPAEEQLLDFSIFLRKGSSPGGCRLSEVP